MSDEAILSVETEIKAVSVKLDELEAAIKDARAAQDKDEVAALRKNEEQLRKEKEQLRAEKLLLLARQPGVRCARRLSSCGASRSRAPQLFCQVVRLLVPSAAVRRRPRVRWP